MIIIGTRGITSSTGEAGRFQCPTCGPNASYRERQVREWLTLYFIPVLPLGVAGKYVECEGCSQAFDPAIVTYDPQVEREAFGRTLTDLLVRLALVDGTFTVEERNVIFEFYRRTTDRPLDAGELTETVERVRREGPRFLETVRAAAANWSGDAIAWFIHAAFSLACAEDEMTPQKQQALAELPRALGVSKEDFQRVVTASAESEQETDA
jgi:hypothetical protein